MIITFPNQNVSLHVIYNSDDQAQIVIEDTKKGVAVSVFLEEEDVAGIVGCLNEFLRKK